MPFFKTPRPDIALFINSMGGGGAERVAATLCNEFVKKGKNVHLLLVQKEGPYLKSLSPKITITSFEKDRVLKTLLSLALYLFRYRPKALLCFMSKANAVGILANLIALKPSRVFVSERGVYSEDIANSKAAKIVKIAGYFIPVLYHLSDKLICVSHHVADDLKKFVSLPAQKTVVIYNPTIREDLLGANKESVKHRWFGNKKYPVILAAGRLSEVKNYPLLIDAFAEVVKHVKARLIILGEGPDKQALSKQIDDLGIKAHVDMVGFVAKPYLYMSKANCFVMCSKSEGLPNALIEALACGCPVVATHSPGGIQELLKSGRYGLMPPANDSKALATALIKVLKHPGAAKKRTNLFKMEQLHQFTPEYVIPQYLSALMLDVR